MWFQNVIDWYLDQFWLQLLVVVLLCGLSWGISRFAIKHMVRLLHEKTSIEWKGLDAKRGLLRVLPYVAPALVVLNVPVVRRWLDVHAWANQAVEFLGVGILCWLSILATRRLLLELVAYLIHRTSIKWDDIFLKSGVFTKLAWLAPALVVANFPDPVPLSNAFVSRVITAYVLAIIVLAMADALDAVNELYNRNIRVAKERPIKGYIQIIKLLLYLIGVIVAIAMLLDRSPIAFLSGLGAMTAILLLVFRDTLLSFVASIQIASNDMVRIGDWVEMPEHGADGDVIDIALHTIKVQNWDKTVTTVPTHKLITDSFRNWRGMAEAGGRRIKRALHLDQNSVCICDDVMLERFERIGLLAEYVRHKRQEVERHNQKQQVDPDETVNGRHLTNLGTFRAYVVVYLKNHNNVREDMTLIVRQLAPGPDGIPLEIYCFANDTRWSVYEGIQADIFDHLLAVLPEFGLRVFQNPSGRDVESLARYVSDVKTTECA